MSNTARSWEKTGGGPINQNSKVNRRDADHDPIDSKEGNTNLYEDESNVGPINTVKSLGKVQLEDKGAGILDFNRVEHFLNNADRLSDLTVLKKPKLFV